MAFLIAIYHFIIWVSDLQGAGSFFGRIGVYGVSIFYILSGLTLYLVYHGNLIFSKPSIFSFFVRRFFRIYPLLWVSMALTLLLDKGKYSFEHLFLSFTGLFGFVAPTKYIGLVTWSIGNELVFYSLFPLLLLTLERKKSMFYIISGGLILTNLYFVFFEFNPKSVLHGQWSTYVNPLNHIALFISGITLGYLVANGRIQLSFKAQIALLIFGVIGLFFYPASGDLIHIVQGWTRVCLVLFSCLICLGFYNFSYQPPKMVHHFFKNIGEVSYSIYLIHPICFTVLVRLNQQIFDIKIRYLFLVYILVTLLMSNFFYNVLEKPFIKLGRKVSYLTKQVK